MECICVWLVGCRSVVVECMATGVSVSGSRRELIDIVGDRGVALEYVGMDVLFAVSWLQLVNASGCYNR